MLSVSIFPLHFQGEERQLCCGSIRCHDQQQHIEMTTNVLFFLAGNAFFWETRSKSAIKQDEDENGICMLFISQAYFFLSSQLTSGWCVFFFQPSIRRPSSAGSPNTNTHMHDLLSCVLHDYIRVLSCRSLADALCSHGGCCCCSCC
jgi:hypothetical protein